MHPKLHLKICTEPRYTYFLVHFQSMYQVFSSGNMHFIITIPFAHSFKNDTSLYPLHTVNIQLHITYFTQNVV
jgi:hypothetical protein